MANASPKRWYRLHPAAIVAGMLVLLAMCGMNLSSGWPGPSFQYDFDFDTSSSPRRLFEWWSAKGEFGWPIIFAERDGVDSRFGRSWLFQHQTTLWIRYDLLVLNLAIGVVLVAGAASAVDGWCRRYGVPTTFRMRTVLILIAWLATIAALSVRYMRQFDLDFDGYLPSLAGHLLVANFGPAIALVAMLLSLIKLVDLVGWLLRAAASARRRAGAGKPSP